MLFDVPSPFTVFLKDGSWNRDESAVCPGAKIQRYPDLSLVFNPFKAKMEVCEGQYPPIL